jgi:DNA adenine methylase
MLDAPFPWFGGKKPVAGKVWAALGNVEHYVEPFFGSGAVLLSRPHAPKVETVNDADGLLANFWRSVRADPEAVAHHADWPTNEADLHARHLWLVSRRSEITRLMADPDAFDAKAAGWWVWGLCNWIGSGWCSGEGPWIAHDGELADSRKLPRLSAGQGINRKLPHLSAGRGINRKLPHMGDAGRGEVILAWFGALAARLRGVRVACGDWTRVCGPSVLRAGGGVCGVFLDPPYSQDDRATVYAHESDAARDCLEWCIANGSSPDLRIVLAGYAGEHDALADKHGWRAVRWKAKGGYGSQGETRGRDNATRETLWLSPHCIGAAPDLFSVAAE